MSTSKYYGTVGYKKTAAFIDKYGEGIAEAIKDTGIFFPTVVGMKCLESGYGEKIPANSNNFGGVKFTEAMLGTVGVVGYVVASGVKWVKYDSIQSGFNAWAKFMKADRYKDARLLAKDPYEQVKMIAKAGYAGAQFKTNPQGYLDKCKAMVQAAYDYSKLLRIKSE